MRSRLHVLGDQLGRTVQEAPRHALSDYLTGLAARGLVGVARAGKLAAQSSCFQLAITAGLRADSTVAAVKDVREATRRPRWFIKRNLDCPLRELEAAANPPTKARDRAGR